MELECAWCGEEVIDVPRYMPIEAFLSDHGWLWVDEVPYCSDRCRDKAYSREKEDEDD
jgi:endogenous inhibitor of DNA gyrase (YacG/DUF329 family)